MMAAAIMVNFAVGALLGLLIDFMEMRKPVPYGDAPALLSLKHIRRLVFALCVFLGAPFLVIAICELMKKRMRVWKRARRRFSRRSRRSL